MHQPTLTKLHHQDYLLYKLQQLFLFCFCLSCCCCCVFFFNFFTACETYTTLTIQNSLGKGHINNSFTWTTSTVFEKQKPQQMLSCTQQGSFCCQSTANSTCNVHGTADKTLVKEVTSLHINYVKDATWATSTLKKYILGNTKNGVSIEISLETKRSHQKTNI